MFELGEIDDGTATAELEGAGTDDVGTRVEEDGAGINGAELEEAGARGAEDAGKGVELAGVCVTGQTVV